MDSPIEVQRRAHEEIDRLESAIADELAQLPPKKHREKLARERYIAALVDRMIARSQYLVASYADANGERAAELKAIESSAEMTEFYNRLRAVKEAHRQAPSAVAFSIETELQSLKTKVMDQDLDYLFSGDEVHGKCLDLNLFFEQYVNLRGVEKCDYIAFLDSVGHFASISWSAKKTPEYQSYLAKLLGYLQGFFERAKPLYDVSRLASSCLEKFEQDWLAGQVPGWPATEQPPADTIAASLYCTACQRPFTNASVFEAHFSGKRHSKAAAAQSEARSIDAKRKELAATEALISAYLDALSSTLDETKANVERKQSRTLAEREEDIEEEEADEAPIEAEDLTKVESERLYNPLRLPLGWDGKPIPYWLYKLHGLGKEYPCEICGNYIYMGRKAFDRHFQEWRHAHGMKCLGIPNTRHFQEVTTIKDALALWEKLKADAKAEAFRPDLMEEFEDLEGNVFNRKTFEDLHRQGLL